MEKVFIYACNDYEEQKVQTIIDNIFNGVGGVDSIVKKGQKVVLKVNLVCGATPDKCCTTHPSIVKAVARRIVEAGAECIIADSPGGPYTAGHLKSVYAKSGMQQLVDEMQGLKVNDDFGEAHIVRQENSVLKDFEMIKILADADVIINLAKFKTHTFMGYSGAVKNMFGAIPGLVKVEMHGRFVSQNSFSQMLIDINQSLEDKMKLSILDSVMCMEGDGPTGGTPKPFGYIFASTSAYALDYAQVIAMGKDINSESEDENIVFPLIKAIKQSGKVQGELEIVGDVNTIPKLEMVIPKCEVYGALKRHIPIWLQPLVHKLMTRRPFIKKRKCAGCGKCAMHCPAKAITMQKTKKGKRYASVDYTKCIRCFCCQELCPFNVVKIKTGLLYKFVHSKKKK